MNLKATLVSCFTALALAPSAFASFHLMQIEQVIASMDGDISAQAIQLRMRASGGNFVSQTRLRVWNAAGTKPVVVLNIDGDVPRSAAGSRVLLATQSFTDIVRLSSPFFTPDFTIINPIPQGSLAAGRLTYETDQGFVMWAVASTPGATSGDSTTTPTATTARPSPAACRPSAGGECSSEDLPARPAPPTSPTMP